MRLFSLRAAAAALGLCVCALLAACSPQDGSAPAATTTNSGPTTAQTAKQPATQPAAQPAAQPATQPSAAEMRRITIQDTQAALAAGNALIVDVRDEGAYKASHIKGAKNIPLSQFEQRVGELPKDKLIITYCA